MLWEIDDALERRNEARPDLVVVQVGVGAFAAAVARHYRSPGVSSHPKLMSVEPVSAACLLESVAAGRLVSVPGPHDLHHVRSGLRQRLHWSHGRRYPGHRPPRHYRRRAQPARPCASRPESGIESGETGAAGLGGLLELVRAGEGEKTRRALGVCEETRVLIFNCEGATDADAYRRIIAG